MTSNLLGLGYTEREAAFLRLAALQSGYFVRRQFNEFNGRECGAVCQRFISRSLDRGHIKPLDALGGRVVYHVCSSQIFARLGDPDNRNRRDHQNDTVRRRLMALDYVLQRREEDWLLTEHEKFEFLSKAQTAGTAAEILAGGAKRMFGDNQPISGGRYPKFGFIDDGLRTLSSWELFLRDHRLLLQNLDQAEVVFASADLGRVQGAENLFRRLVAGEVARGRIDSARLARFFEARKLFEAKRYEHFDKGRLDELREDKRVFAGQQFELLFQRWQEQGDSALGALQSSRVRFCSQALPNKYEWLTPIRFHQRRA